MVRLAFVVADVDPAVAVIGRLTVPVMVPFSIPELEACVFASPA